ncbi:ATP-binding cassette domain-containing protein [Halobacillus litoralis]|uniref:ATP-binding cassette domain-containing protein n=1 Tax=Halobacillus litoralis TaxID=45668 RepID=A0A845F719_9BACI|nr:ABC transporter ATP-binding protein [Halobacillus litoralis]MYL69923.1 ATP-binding cassette domain-containing protein [Halobacillus litoralis]
MKHVLYFLKEINSYSGKVLYINLFAMTVIGLLEGVGILLLVPLISLSGIVDLGTQGLPFMEAFQFVEQIPPEIGLPSILLFYVGIVIAQNLLQRRITVRNAVIHQGFMRHLRMNTYDSLLHAKWEFYLNKRKSDLVNIMTGEIARAASGTQSFLQFAASLVFTLIQVGLAFVLSPNITTFVIICGFILILFNRKFLKRSLELGNRSYSLNRRYLSGVTDQLNGMKDLKSNTLEGSRGHWHATITKGMQDEQVEYTKLKATSRLYYKIASSILIAAFIFIAIQLFNAQAGQLMLVIVIFSRLWPRVTGIQASMEQIAKVIPSLEAVNSVRHESELDREFMEESQRNEPLKVNEAIECHNLSFQYKKESRYALKNINITIPSQQMTAIVGRSGAGKSTLIDMLMGLNYPDQGEVLIDGDSISEEKIRSLRKAISYVPQDPFLFNESIRDNLLLVDPEANEEAIWEALEFSSAAEFVRELPQGLDTLIGDRGIKLSGGERQRLVLARAILRKPSILILDEATSALDSENEKKIQEAIEQLKGRMTIIVIAHRLSTIRNADQVIVLEEGEVVQKGDFHQLAKDKKNVFSHLLNHQMKVVH